MKGRSRSDSSGLQERREAAAATGIEGSPYAERQEVIRTAAARVFHRLGFHATKLNDVAAEAGMDRATLYYYVSSKRALFDLVVAGAIEKNVQDIEALEAQTIPAIEKIERMLVLLMKSFEDGFPSVYVFVQEDLRKLAGSKADRDWVEQMHGWTDRYFQAAKRIVAAGIESGELQTALPPSIVANSLIGMMTSSHEWFVPNGLMNAEEIGRGVARMVTRGLAEPSPRRR